ncbi:MAG: methylamine utilization protein/Cytochrome c peroxidase, partial [Reyranella sp.]|nr:methylamine utilization protein/Cytochrome c peroxidase [Reyranella sp.]
MTRLLLLVSLLAVWARGVHGQQLLDWSPEEVRIVGQHGPWPPPAVRDPSNKVSGTPAGIALGEHLFNEPRLSGDGRMSCGTCHQAGREWS